MNNSQHQPGSQFNSDIRRNLFRVQPPKRPTTSSSTATTATTLLEAPNTDDKSNEILIRGQNGHYAPTFPALPAPDVEEASDDANKIDEAKIEDMLKNRSHQQNEQELLEAVRASLRRTADSLGEDSWMYAPKSGYMR